MTWIVISVRPVALQITVVEGSRADAFALQIPAGIEDPNATVVVKEIHSRNVFITGNVAKPATYPLTGNMNVLQLIALGGGLLEYADSKNIVIIRSENGHQDYHKFNYNDVVKRRHTEQNIMLKPGDTVVVP